MNLLDLSNVASMEANIKSRAMRDLRSLRGTDSRKKGRIFSQISSTNTPVGLRLSNSLTPGDFCTSQSGHRAIHMHRGMCRVI
jgi:hypothetical protein